MVRTGPVWIHSLLATKWLKFLYLMMAEELEWEHCFFVEQEGLALVVGVHQGIHEAEGVAQGGEEEDEAARPCPYAEGEVEVLKACVVEGGLAYLALVLLLHLLGTFARGRERVYVLRVYTTCIFERSLVM
jgi:hypothetical protein